MPLPFGLKLKRTRRYTVSSKSCLVARIQLLNNEFVEFTLSVESTGQESLEAVAQRLELREVSELPSKGVIFVSCYMTCVLNPYHLFNLFIEGAIPCSYCFFLMGPWLAPNCKTDVTELGNAQGGGHVRSDSE